MIELLAPSGSKESFFSAINGGANAVYLGLDLFSARKNAENFTKENLPFYITYAHILGVKVYVTLNTLIGDKELDVFLNYVEFCNDNFVDGIILQDMLLGKYLHERFPNLELHLSTQAGVNNVYGATLAKEYGFSRVVLARETPIFEIEKITKIIETEVFIQGALCTAFSGQCYLSSFAGNNSGNRGLCKQPCRKLYTLKNDKIEKTGYDISLADLCVNEKVFDLLNAGVTSLKIEGRMRKPSYVYYATKYYSDLLSNKNPSISPLTRTFNRGNYTYGLAFGQDKNLISDKIQSHVGEVIGKIASINQNFLKIKSEHVFSTSDSGKILRNGEEVGNYTVDTNLRVKYQGAVKVNDVITLTCDVKLENDYLKNKKSLPISLLANFFSGEVAKITASINDKIVEVVSDFLLEKAVNRPLTKEEIKDNLSKCGDLPFSPDVTVETDGVFIAKSQLNALRRSVYDKIVKELTRLPERTKKEVSAITIERRNSNSLLIIDEDFFDIKDFAFSIAVLAPKNYNDLDIVNKFLLDLKNNPCEKYLYLPPLLNSNDSGLVAKLLPNFDGVYTDGYYGIELSKTYGKKCILGSGVNIYNKISASEALKICDDFVLSKELTVVGANKLTGYYYSAGGLKVMDLEYCPFGKTCNNCKGTDYSTLSDGERDFILRRVKLSGCRFELYNAFPLLTDGSVKQVFNFITLSRRQKIALLNNLNNPLNAKLDFESYTTGHSKKPLL